MKTLLVFEYIAKFGDREIMDDFIATWTFPLMPKTPRCSHSELGFPSRGVSFSFTTRNGMNGARFTELRGMLKHPERWLVTEIEVEDWQERAAFEHCVSELNKSYSYLSLLTGFTVGYGTNGKKGNYCSRGGVAWPLFTAGVLKKKYSVVSPRGLFKILTRMGFSFTEVTDEFVKRLSGVPEQFLCLIKG